MQMGFVLEGRRCRTHFIGVRPRYSTGTGWKLMEYEPAFEAETQAHQKPDPLADADEAPDGHKGAAGNDGSQDRAA